MTDRIFRIVDQEGFTTPLDVEQTTTTAAGGPVIRPRMQISARDITTGTPTDVGDAVNNAIRVVIQNSSVTTSGGGGSSVAANVTVSNWIATQVVSITGTITNVVAVSLSQVVLSSNTTATTPTGPAVQVIRSLAEALAPIWQVVSTTAVSATIVPGVAGKRIYVLGYHLVVNPATNVNFEDSAQNGLTGSLQFAANSGVSAVGTIDAPVFAVVTSGNALRIKQSTTATLGGSVTVLQF